MQLDEQATVVVHTGPRRRPPSSAARTTLSAAVVVLLLAGVSVLVWPAAFRSAATSTGGEVYRESTGAPGRDPFSGTVVVGNPPGTKSQTPIAAAAGTVPKVAGDVPALYGGSRNEHVCDRQKLVSFLEQNPDKSAAWAGVLGIDTADIPTYIAGLTPVQLRADTRVTNHGFFDGRATSLQSVLQAGTAVLVDDHGLPRVKCGCGNPLLDPVATPVTPVYTGDTWPDFNPANVSAVAPGAAQVDRFLLADLRTGDTFYRPRGTDGDQDQPTTPPVATTTPPMTAPITPPTSTAIACPSGTHLSGTACVANAPAPCPAGQVREGRRCAPTEISCPDGRHASGDGTSCDPDQPGCPEGQHRDDGSCVPDRSEGGCPEGTHAKSTLCVSDAVPTCEDGYHVSYTNKCTKDCPDGYRQAARDNCVPDRPSCPSSEGGSGTCPGTGTRRPGRRRSGGPSQHIDAVARVST